MLADKKHLRFIRRSPKPLRLNKQRNTSTFRSGDISLPILAAEFVLSRRIPVPVCRLCPASGFCWQLPGADGLLQQQWEIQQRLCAAPFPEWPETTGTARPHPAAPPRSSGLRVEALACSAELLSRPTDVRYGMDSPGYGHGQGDAGHSLYPYHAVTSRGWDLWLIPVSCLTATWASPKAICLADYRYLP